MKSGNLNFLEPSGPLQACNGTALPIIVYHLKMASHEPKHVAVIGSSVMISCACRVFVIFTRFYIPQNTQHMIYLLTAIGLTPGGSITAHIYTQTIHRTTQKFWKSVDRAPSWWVIPWHLPYNWGKSMENPSVSKGITRRKEKKTV